MKQATMELAKGLQAIQQLMLRASAIDDYVAVLPALLDIVEAGLDDPHLDRDRMHEMAGYLAEIRFLLSQIDQNAGARTDSLTLLRIADRFRDLEGTFKERRNDRSPLRQGKAGTV